MNHTLMTFLVLLISIIRSLAVEGELRQLIVDNGFENNSPSWEIYARGDPPSVGIAQTYPYKGSNYAYLGDFNSNTHDSAGSIRQGFTVPKYTTLLALQFYVSISSNEDISQAKDFLEISITDANGIVYFTLQGLSNKDRNSFGDFVSYTDTLRTQEVNRQLWDKKLYLEFKVKTDGQAYTTFRIDNVSFIASIVPPSYHTITSSSGTGGTIAPAGPIEYEADSSVTFEATPNPDHIVDKWLINGDEVRSGGSSYVVNPVSRSMDLKVTFAPKDRILTLLATNGTIVADPLMPSYPFGTTVTLRAVPDSGFIFNSWTGGPSGRENPIILPMNSDRTVIANFIENIESFKMESLTFDESTISFELKITKGWQYIIQVTESLEPGKATTTDMLVIRGEGDLFKMNNTDNQKTSKFGGTMMLIKLFKDWFRVETESSPKVVTAVAEVIPKGEMFLTFPIEGVTNPWSAKITAVMDHCGDHLPDGKFKSAFGQSANLFSGPVYKSVDGKASRYDYNYIDNQKGIFGFALDDKYTEWILPLSGYNDQKPIASAKSIMWYDGHKGYDYAYPRASNVIAAADGVVDIGETQRVLGIYNGIALLHPNGFKTYYLHLTQWENPDWIKRIGNGEIIQVKARQRLGNPGNYGVQVEGVQDINVTNGVHLHFAVRNSNGDRVDPYGRYATNETSRVDRLWLVGPLAE